MAKTFSLGDLKKVTSALKQEELRREAELKRQENARIAQEQKEQEKLLKSRKRLEEFEKGLAKSESSPDQISFAEQMKGVKKLTQDKIPTTTKMMDRDAALKLREMAEDEKKEEDMSFFSTAGMIFVEPTGMLSYRTPGLQYGVFRKLKAGEYSPETWVDLHNHTVENAYKDVRKTIVRAIRKNMRCILIIHGKGEFSEPKALLKSYVAHWLSHMPEVLGYHTAMPYHGGAGSTYVLLKKGPEARLETREEIAARR